MATNTFTERQMDALYRVHRSINEFLEFFEKTDGFNSLWFEIEKHEKHETAGIVEMRLNEIVDKVHDQVEGALHTEEFDLHGLEIYSDLENYIEERLNDIYQGKLSFAYRFEAPVEKVSGGTVGVPLEEDLEAARQDLAAIYRKHGIWD